MRFSILPVLFVIGCSSSTTSPTGGPDAGGGSGGSTSGNGGSTASSGGASGSGGKAGTGGTTSAGGTVGTGGKTGAGGTAGSASGGVGGTTSPDAGNGTGGTSGTGDSGADSGSTADAGPVTYTLKIENYLAWCTVAVNGGASSADATVTVSFPRGTVVNLGGDKVSATFEWGYWRGTAGDTTPSHDASTTTTVTMDGDRTVQACCPFASGAQAHAPCPDPT